MTIGGWIFFIITWGIIISLVVFSYGRVIKGSNNKDDQENYKVIE
jgi:hypothetical protein